MLIRVRLTTYVLMYFLVFFSVLGVVVSSQQYFILQSEEKSMSARRTLDDGFIIVMKSMGGESNPNMAKELTRQKTILEATYSGAAAMIHQLEIRAIADLIAWGVFFVISSWALILEGRKQAEKEKKAAG